jgi:anti-sigma regulatory factor (Ser/Thr protein kinase)
VARPLTEKRPHAEARTNIEVLMPVSTIARPTGHPGYSETLPCTAASAEGARKLVRAALATWNLDALTEDAALIVTELVANAVQHTRSHHIRVTVTRPETTLVRIQVTDRSKDRPRARHADDVDENGRGLDLVAALTARWGTDVLPWGKRVWGELNT